MISFSTGREDLAECHLEINLVDSQYRPLPALLMDHLAQGVWRCCLFPGWKHGHQQHLADLDFIIEERMFAEDYEPQDDDPADPATVLAARQQHLDLDRMMGAGAQLEQRSMKEWESGKGKSYFENYLDAALSIGGYTEEGLTSDVE